MSIDRFLSQESQCIAEKGKKKYMCSYDSPTECLVPAERPRWLMGTGSNGLIVSECGFLPSGHRVAYVQWVGRKFPRDFRKICEPCGDCTGGSKHCLSKTSQIFFPCTGLGTFYDMNLCY